MRGELLSIYIAAVFLSQTVGVVSGAVGSPLIRDQPARLEAAAAELAPKTLPSMSKLLDELFKRLQTAKDGDEAKSIATAIEHIWLNSSSDTANLLMSRAITSIESKNYAVGLEVLDQLVELYPDWAAAWNERATLRYLTNDVDGAMSDVGRVLKAEPRQFDALNGLAAMLLNAGLDKRALEILKDSLSVYPQQPAIVKQVETLSIEVNGRDI
jgi:tetratricopeptide (TPR) repeat protein